MLVDSSSTMVVVVFSFSLRAQFELTLGQMDLKSCATYRVHREDSKGSSPPSPPRSVRGSAVDNDDIITHDDLAVLAIVRKVRKVRKVRNETKRNETKRC